MFSCAKKILHVFVHLPSWASSGTQQIDKSVPKMYSYAKDVHFMAFGHLFSLPVRLAWPNNAVQINSPPPPKNKINEKLTYRGTTGLCSCEKVKFTFRACLSRVLLPIRVRFLTVPTFWRQKGARCTNSDVSSATRRRRCNHDTTLE